MSLSRAAAAVLPIPLLALAVAAAPAGFDSSRAFEHIRQLVALGPRPAGSPGNAQARAYIAAQLEAIGLTPSEQAFDADTPFGTIRMVNVIARIPGQRTDRLLITGHYDTKLFRQFRFVGANDGGSSAAMLLELARVLKARSNPLTIELVFFDGEEAMRPDWAGTDHTYGSRHYVATARRAGTLTGIKAMVLVDMIADRQLQDAGEHDLVQHGHVERAELGRHRRRERQRTRRRRAEPETLGAGDRDAEMRGIAAAIVGRVLEP